MADSACEMSAEELTEALSLEEKPEASSLALKSAETGSYKHSRTSQEKIEDSTSTYKNPDQVASADNAVEPNAAEQANAQWRRIYTNKEPLDIVPFIEKYVRIQLERNYFYVGFVHSIDPITHSVILSVPKEDGKYQTVLIPGTSVLDIIEVPCDSSIIPPKRKPVRELPPDDIIQERKKKILSWFKENRLPVTEEGENIVFGAITLLPPYEEKDISSSNPLIALEIKKIIDRMPADYQPK